MTQQHVSMDGRTTEAILSHSRCHCCRFDGRAMLTFPYRCPCLAAAVGMHACVHSTMSISFCSRALEAELDALASHRSPTKANEHSAQRATSLYALEENSRLTCPPPSETLRPHKQSFSLVCPAFAFVWSAALGELGAIRALLTNASLVSEMGGAILGIQWWAFLSRARCLYRRLEKAKSQGRSQATFTTL